MTEKKANNREKRSSEAFAEMLRKHGMDFPSRVGLDSYLASEPYAAGQVREKIEIKTINVVIGGK